VVKLIANFQQSHKTDDKDSLRAEIEKENKATIEAEVQKRLDAALTKLRKQGSGAEFVSIADLPGGDSESPGNLSGPLTEAQMAGLDEISQRRVLSGR